MVRHHKFGGALVIVVAATAAACGGGGSPTPAGSVAASTPPAGSVTPSSSLTLDAPSSVKGGAQFSVAWTGVPVLGDYLTIVASGATKATPDSYVNISGAGPATLSAPNLAGAYEIWWVTGDTLDGVKARRPLTVT